MVTDKFGFTWGWCDLCEAWYVKCPDCGNNCCNAGTGELPDGTICGCSVAYKHQDKYDKPLLEDDSTHNQ